MKIVSWEKLLIFRRRAKLSQNWTCLLVYCTRYDILITRSLFRVIDPLWLSRITFARCTDAKCLVSFVPSLPMLPSRRSCSFYLKCFREHTLGQESLAQIATRTTRDSMTFTFTVSMGAAKDSAVAVQPVVVSRVKFKPELAGVGNIVSRFIGNRLGATGFSRACWKYDNTEASSFPFRDSLTDVTLERENSRSAKRPSDCIELARPVRVSRGKHTSPILSSRDLWDSSTIFVIEIIQLNILPGSRLNRVSLGLYGCACPRLKIIIYPVQIF